jgi:hypothetical protein
MSIELKPNLSFDFSSIQAYIEQQYRTDFNGHTEIPIARYPTTMVEFFEMVPIFTMGFDWISPVYDIIENVAVEVEHSVENEEEHHHCEIIFKFTPEGYDPIYIRYTGFGDSYADAEWDDGFEYVIPREVKVTKYFKTSKKHYAYI